MFGYHGRYLKVDARSGLAALQPLDEAVLRRFLGGVGLGTWVVARETPAGADPLGPDATLVFALSPLVGTPLTTSAKFAVVALSPLTGRLCDALSSSHFALAAKRAGVDAIAINGACDEPSVLLVDGQGRGEPLVSWRPAGEFWGLSPSEAEARLRTAIGPEWQVASIGPAGERLIPFATISHDGRHAGRGGLGAVLGSKRIKAVAVRGDRHTPVADPERTIALRATSRPAPSARRPRSTASWAPSPTCSCSTASRPCRPATSRQARSLASSGLPPRISARRGG